MGIGTADVSAAAAIAPIGIGGRKTIGGIHVRSAATKQRKRKKEKSPRSGAGRQPYLRRIDKGEQPLPYL